MSLGIELKEPKFISWLPEIDQNRSYLVCGCQKLTRVSDIWSNFAQNWSDFN